MQLRVFRRPVAASTGLIAAAVLALIAMAAPALASEASLQGAHLPLALAAPFAGILLSIALGPVVAREWWHIHYAKASLFWAVAALVGLGVSIGAGATAAAFAHNMADEYLPFILMLFALFTAAGGVAVSGKLQGAPLLNSLILGVGALIASLIGTTGASMILVRPLLRANANRRFKAHIVVFFIFLVANIGGALSPLGDPPLFLGFLEGVDFFWPMRNLWPETLFAVAALLILFFLIDLYFYRRETGREDGLGQVRPLRISGLVNIPLIGLVTLVIALSGIWRPGVALEAFGVEFELQNLVRNASMLCIGLASLALTKESIRAHNGFEWEPIKEVAYLFAGIFTCIIPVMAMLHAGKGGPFAPVITLLSLPDGAPNNPVYFWATGLLSSFLDNAPTYLVFFEMAGGDPTALMEPLARTLAAISLGSVFMGANTYIGNAPNLMVYSMARRAGVRMPSFLAYMLWSGAILLPLFAAITWLFFLQPEAAPKENLPPPAAVAAAPSDDLRHELSAAAAQIEALRAEVADLRDKLGSAQLAQASSTARDRELQNRIADLEARLEKPKPQNASSIEPHRAQFLKDLSDALGDRPDVRVSAASLTIKADALFRSRSAEIDTGGRRLLDRVAAAVIAFERGAPQDLPWVLRVQGHADATPIRSRQFSSIFALSAARAVSVVEYLVKKGVSPQRLAAIGFGEYRPLDQAQSEEAKRKNRRIELTIAD